MLASTSATSVRPAAAPARRPPAPSPIAGTITARHGIHEHMFNADQTIAQVRRRFAAQLGLDIPADSLAILDGTVIAPADEALLLLQANSTLVFQRRAGAKG